MAVVGLGPVGATAANLAHDLGLRVVAFDRAAEVEPRPRAIGFDQEVMRVFAGFGLADAIADHVMPYRPSEYHNGDGRVIKRIHAGPPPHPLGWEPNYVFLQPQVEGVLRQRLARADGVDVRLGTEVTEVASTVTGPPSRPSTRSGGGRRTTSDLGALLTSARRQLERVPHGRAGLTPYPRAPARATRVPFRLRRPRSTAHRASHADLERGTTGPGPGRNSTVDLAGQRERPARYERAAARRSTSRTGTNHMSRVRSTLAATALAAMFSTALAGGTAAAGEVGTMAQGGKCDYNQLDKPAWRSHKGKGDDRYNDGKTKKYGRELILSTGTGISDDNSAAMLSGKVRKGDEVWVDISHDKGKNWKGACGNVKAAEKGQKVYSKWYAHYRDDITKRVIRACARTTTGATDTGKRVTWCADIGDVKQGSARWWSDKD